MSRERLDELLKLRGEVVRLREQTNQIGALIDTNQKLAALLKEKAASTDSSQKERPEDALPQDIHPRASWVFRGYNSPDDDTLSDDLMALTVFTTQRNVMASGDVHTAERRFSGVSVGNGM